MTNKPHPRKHHGANNNNKEYHHIHFGSINVRTAKCEMKLAEHVMHIKSLKHDICCIQETHIVGQGEVEFKDPDLKGWRIIYSGLKRKAQAGVAIVLAPHVKIVDIEYQIEGRLLLTRISVYGTKLAIISCYAPTEEYSTSVKEAYHNNLTNIIKSTKLSHPSFKLLIGGDFNATIGNDCQSSNWRCVGPYNDDEPTSFNGMKLLEMAETNNLFILNTMFATKSPTHRWTFKSNLGYLRRLDYILGEWYIKRATTNCRAYPGVSDAFESDHRVVVLTAMLPTKKSRKKIFRKKSKKEHCILNVKTLRDDEKVVSLYSDRLDELLAQPPQTEQVDEIADFLVNNIRKASEETIPTISKTKEIKPWANDDFINALTERRKSTNEVERKELSRKIRQLRIQLKSAFFKDKASKINHANEQRMTEEEFRLAKNYKAIQKSKQHLIQPEKLEKHFAHHFGRREFNIQPELSQPEDYPHILPPEDFTPIDESPPETPEVQKCLTKFKNGKCQGTDRIYGEQLKYSKSIQLVMYLVTLLGIIWKAIEVPSSWLYSSITCLHKKGPRTQAENYRGLSIIATLSKLVSMVIVERIRTAYESILLPTQFGFRKNRSTTDAIFIVQHILKMSSRERQPLFLCFIDLKAAYDWIPREALFRVLEIRLKCPKLIAILRSLYTGTKACIKNLPRYFDTFVGCRQGALESPVIFNIYMDFVMRCAKHEVLRQFPEHGTSIKYAIPNEVSPRSLRTDKSHGTIKVTDLSYADDVVVFSENISDLQQVIEIYDKTFSRFGLTMSYKKTETMAFNVDEEIKEQDSLITINGIELKNVRQFRYLGHLITNNNNTSEFLYSRISSAFEKWNELKQVLTDREIHLNTRMKILVACVRSRLLYSVQAWELTKTQIQKLETIWNNFLRKMITGGYARKNAPPRSKKKKGVDPTSLVEGELDWSYKISNDKLHQITSTQPIELFYFTQHLQYIAHVCRMENNMLLKQVLFDKRNTLKNIERIMDIDKTQILRAMMNKNDLKQLLAARFDQ